MARKFGAVWRSPTHRGAVWRRRGFATSLLFLSGLFLAGCGTQPMDTFTADAGPASERITGLFIGVLIVAIIILILVEGTIIYMVHRFKAKRRLATHDATNGTNPKVANPATPTQIHDPYDPDNPQDLSSEALPKQTHGNFRLEIAWTIIPTIILVVVAVFTLIAIYDLEEVTAEDDTLRVTVVGQQWWWEFQYHLDGDTESPPDIVSPGELVIPVGLQVPLEITARDVIHSFWIPQLNGKKDAAPGRVHDWLIEASRPGRYLGACTEFCGVGHGYMRMYTVALQPQDWGNWVSEQRQPAPLLSPGDSNYNGQQLFLENCARCHSISGVTDTNGDDLPDTPSIYSGANAVQNVLVAGAAPDLTHLMSRATFAGATYDLYEDRAEDVPYTQIAEQGQPNVVDLERWISNAPSEKPAVWEDGRGMPPFPNLTGQDLDDLVNYLMTLD